MTTLTALFIARILRAAVTSRVKHVSKLHKRYTRLRFTGMFVLASQFSLTLFGRFLLRFRLLICSGSVYKMTRHTLRKSGLTELGLLYRNLDGATGEIGRSGCASHDKEMK